ncbi:MAG: methylmalonyl-CoA mutase family protein [Gemmatimonadota bacterium]
MKSGERKGGETGVGPGAAAAPGRGAADAGRDAAAFHTDSGIPVVPIYRSSHVPPDLEARLGEPGVFPFTRGVYPSMYRGRSWTMRQYAGFGTARETNDRYRYLLERGQTGLSVAFDLPTQMGFDSDDAMAQGEVGRAGVAIDSLEDMRELFAGIDLGGVSTSMTINATAPILLALYVALADETGVSRDRLSGTVQNDILKEYVARGTYIYPVEPSLRLVTDVLDFAAREVPRWNGISISGYHIREAGSSAPQELAFTLANGLEYVKRALARNIELESFAPRLSFFFAAHNDLFEEVAKFRAARRLWATLLRDRFGGSEKACRLRFHTQTGGSTLTAQQPLNNVARVTLQALSAVLGGTQSLHTNSYDEALSLPSEEAARVALRTQQILAHESGVERTVDPLAGSWFVESLTDAVEAEAMRLLGEIDERGGAARSVEWMQDEIHLSAYAHQLRVESGEQVVVGVNQFQEDEADHPLELPDYSALETEQAQRLVQLRERRDSAAVEAALTRVAEVAGTEENLLPPLVDAVKAMATVGEISHCLRREWGTFQPGG